MRVTAKLSAEHAATDEERSRVHASGPYAGFFFISHTVPAPAGQHDDGTLDFAGAYLEALRQFLGAEPRVGQGHAFEVLITA